MKYVALLFALVVTPAAADEVLIGNGYISASDTSWCFNHTTMEAWSEPGKTCHEKTADRVAGWKAEATCTKGTVQVPCKPPGSR